MGGDRWPIEPLSNLLAGIEAGKSPDLPDSPAGPGEWGVLKVSAVHTSGFRATENKRVDSPGVVDVRYRVHPGDLLISRANTPELVGSACIASEASARLLLSDKTLRLKVDPTRALTAYVNICLASPGVRRQIVNAASGSSRSMQNIGQKAIERLRLPVPPIEEQQLIVDVLDSIGSRIAWTLRELEKREFVQQGLLSDFLKPMDSGLSEGWAHGNFGDFVRLQRGFDITVAEQRPGVVPVVSSSGISSFHDVPKVKGPGVVTGRKGKLGGVYYLEGDYWPHDTSLWVTDFKGNDPYFVAIYMRAMHLERYDAATSVPTLNRNVVHKLPASFPDPAKQREIVASMRASAGNSAALQDEVAKLRGLKQGLVDDLLSGRVGVSAAAV